MATAVALPPLSVERSRPGSSRGNEAVAGGATGNSAAPLSARGPLFGGSDSTFKHLTFDSSSRSVMGMPPNKAADRDRLRNKLMEVGQRFVGFDQVIESDTIQRRQVESAQRTAAQEVLLKLEKAMNSEIKRRVDANKHVQSLTEQLANDMLERLQASILVKTEKLASSLETLTLRGTALEKGIAQFRGELPSKLQVDTAALVKEITELRRHMETDRKSRVERDTVLLRRLAEMETHEASRFDQGSAQLQSAYNQFHEEIDGLGRTVEVSDSRTEKFRAFILEEIAGMKNTLTVCAQAREQTDDEIVQALTRYTDALQHGLRSANNGLSIEHGQIMQQYNIVNNR